jgi:hypothetical protein
MNAADKKALEELQAYLDSRDEKTNKQSDKRLIAQNNKPPKSDAARAALRKTVSDPDYKKLQRQNTLEKNKDPIYKENQRKGIEKRIANPNFSKNQSAAQLKKFEDPEYVKSFHASMEKRSKNKKWMNSLKEKSKQKWKPVITPEGPFKRFGEAVQHYMKVWCLKKGGSDYRLRQYLNDILNTDFKWISVEEYIMLTGLDPFNE